MVGYDFNYKSRLVLQNAMIITNYNSKIVHYTRTTCGANSSAEYNAGKYEATEYRCHWK